MVASVYFSAIFAGYLAGFIAYFADVETRSASLLRWARGAVLVSLALHLVALAAPFFGCHIMASAVRPEFAVPFFILALALVIEIRSRASFLILFSLPIALVLLVAAVGRGPEKAGLLTAQSAWLWIHLAFVFTGMAVLVVAVSSAAMYLFQRAQLKSHRPGKFFLGLPSLDTLERVHTRALVAGLLLFTLGLISGAFWAEKKSQLSLFGKDPTVILSVSACALYWGILGMRLSSIGRGRKIALGTVGVFVLLLLAALHTHAS